MIDQIIFFIYKALFFLTPLIMTKSTSELFEFNKMIFIYISTVLIAFFWLLKMIINRKIILKKTFLDIPILTFFLTQLISTIYSMDLHTSIFGYYGRFNGGLLSTVCYIVLYYAFVSNKIDVQKILKTIIASSLLVIFWAVPGHFGHDLTCLIFSGQFNNSCWDNSVLAFRPDLRAFSTLGQPNWLGAYLAVAFFIGIYFLIKKNQDTKYLILNTLYLFSNFSVILFSRSRSAIGAVIVGLMLFIVYYIYFIKIDLKKILLILFIVIAVPIIFFKTGIEKFDRFLTFATYKNVFVRKTNVPLSPPTSSKVNVTESFDIRKIVWEGAWKLGLKYPFFGTGVETFAYSYNFVRPIAHNLTSEWDYVYNKAHNEYLNYLATTGFIGLGAYLLLIFIFQFSMFNQILKIKNLKLKIEENQLNKQLLTVLLVIAYITILITNFFGFSTTTIQIFFFMIPAFIIASAGLSPQDHDLPTTKFSLLQKFIFFLLLILTVYFLFSITVYYLADINYSYGSKYAKVSDQQQAALYFEKALSLRQDPVYEDRLSSSLAYLSAVSSLQDQKELGRQIAAMSDSYNRKTVQKYPKNVFYWKTRAKNMYYFYQVTGNENELLQGVEALKTARSLYSTDPKIPYTLSLYYSTLYDAAKNNSDKQVWQNSSLKEINNTIILKSNYRDAYLFKGQLLKKYGETAEAKKVFEYMFKNFDANDEDVIKELQSL